MLIINNLICFLPKPRVYHCFLKVTLGTMRQNFAETEIDHPGFTEYPENPLYSFNSSYDWTGCASFDWTFW